MRTEKMVTRTISYYNACVMFVNIKAQTIGEKYFAIPELIPEKKRLEYVDKKCEIDGLKAVQITSIEKIEELYAMTETEFLAHARKIDKR